MKKTLLIICILLIKENIKAQANQSDSIIIVNLYKTTGGYGWTNSKNWLTSKKLSTWYGIYCDFKGNVISISLINNNLTGTIP